MTPEHAKKLLRALSDNISKYEDGIGSIREGDQINIPLNLEVLKHRHNDFV